MTDLEALEAGIADGSIRYTEHEMDHGAKMGAAIEVGDGENVRRLGTSAPIAAFSTERAKAGLAQMLAWSRSYAN